MEKKSLKLTIIFMSALTLMTSVIVAEESSIKTPSEICDNCSYRNEHVSQAVRAEIEEKRMQFAEEQQKNSSVSTTSEDDEITSGSWVLDLHNNCRHRVIARGDAFETIRFEDESLWQISYHDRHIISNWMMEHRLYIEPNWNSAFHYKIVNYDRDESVLVNPVDKPDVHSPYSRRVIRIEYGKIILNDGTCWNLSSVDMNSVKIWAPGDLVIVGVNRGFLSLFYSYIIYNFSKDVNLIANYQH